MAGRPKGIVKTGGRKKGTPNKKTAAQREATADFFARIVNDKAEARFWHSFMNGSETNPIAFQAFKRAVEYKRGMPREVIEHTGAGGGQIEHTIRFAA